MSRILDGGRAQLETLKPPRPEACDWSDMLFSPARRLSDQKSGHLFIGGQSGRSDIVYIDIYIYTMVVTPK